MVESGRTADARRKLTTFMLRRSSAVPIAMISTISLMHQLENPSPDPYTHRLGLSMAITRLVNGTTDQFQPRGDRSIARSVASIASELGMPLELVEIRHQACHNDLPSLSFLKYASRDALAWLKGWYWEPQLRNVWPYVKNSSYVLAKVFKGEINQAEQQIMASELEQPAAPEPLSVNLKRSEVILERMTQLNFRLEELKRKNAAKRHGPLVSRSLKYWGSTTFGLLPGQRWAPRASLLSKRPAKPPGADDDDILPVDDADTDQGTQIADVNYSEKPLLQDEINDANVNDVGSENYLQAKEEPLFQSKVAEFQLIAAKVRANQRKIHQL